MAISMVRKPSETPNINNIDDIIPFRYAYGNQNGYVIGRGAEVSHTVNGNQFTINSGRLVIQGVESDIDANGVTLTIDSVSETRYYVIYHEINLATNTANIKVQFDTTTYPTINEGDDLTQNSSGIANLILYKFISQNGEIGSVEKVVKPIDYTGTALVGYDNSKGTVEERLTKLGFKQDNIVTSGSGDIVGNVKRQGNYVLGSFKPSSQSISISPYVPQGFRPKEKVTFGALGYLSLTGGGVFSSSQTQRGGSTPSITIFPTGKITIINGESISISSGSGLATAGTQLLSSIFGYEATDEIFFDFSITSNFGSTIILNDYYAKQNQTFKEWIESDIPNGDYVDIDGYVGYKILETNYYLYSDNSKTTKVKVTDIIVENKTYYS